MKIGFYGDSFCCEISNPHSILAGYETYIKKIKDHYDAEIVHLGTGGSSVWDVILQQFNADDVPEICIFCWTDPYRLYNKNVRNITYGSLKNKKIKDYKLSDLIYYRTISAAKKYFEYLYDSEKSQIEYQAALQYFDNNILKNVKSKIIHLWSFEKKYVWNNGINTDIPLNSFVTGSTLAANHLDGEEINEQVFQMIKEFIDDHRRPSL